MVEEQNHGRIILYNNRGEKEWELINMDENGDIGIITWARVIEDEEFIERYKLLLGIRDC